MGKMRCSAVLSIRRSDFLGYLARLKALAAEAGVADAIRILPSASPSEMMRLAAQHDAGLSLELNTPPCRAICLTNKIFTYLLAGIPTFLSDTPAQRELALELGQAARVVSLTSPGLMAEVLDSWASDAKSYSAASSEAWRSGRTQFNWDIEKKRFIKKITDALAGRVVVAVDQKRIVIAFHYFSCRRRGYIDFPAMLYTRLLLHNSL
jgi:glycosyltransferase involved in cell wall biosynthesis